jgi:hypothetical protein
MVFLDRQYPGMHFNNHPLHYHGKENSRMFMNTFSGPCIDNHSSLQYPELGYRVAPIDYHSSIEPISEEAENSDKFARVVERKSVAVVPTVTEDEKL